MFQLDSQTTLNPWFNLNIYAFHLSPASCPRSSSHQPVRSINLDPESLLLFPVQNTFDPDFPAANVTPLSLFTLKILISSFPCFILRGRSWGFWTHVMSAFQNPCSRTNRKF